MKTFFLILILIALTGTAQAATQKTHGCASNNGGSDVAFVDVVVGDKGTKFLKYAPDKGAIRHFVVTRETPTTANLTTTKLEGWEVDQKTGKTLSSSISMELPARASLQGELALDGKTRKVRCSRSN